MMELSELRDRLQDEFRDREPPIQWNTFMLGKVAQLEDALEDARIDKANAERLRDNMFAENAELKRIYMRIQDADHPGLELPNAMTVAMAEMTALLKEEDDEYRD